MSYCIGKWLNKSGPVWSAPRLLTLGPDHEKDDMDRQGRGFPSQGSQLCFWDGDQSSLSTVLPVSTQTPQEPGQMLWPVGLLE